MATRMKLPTEDEMLRREAAGEDALTEEEYFAMFDDAVRQRMGISADEFIERWNAGVYDDIDRTPLHLEVAYLEGFIPFERRKRRARG